MSTMMKKIGLNDISQKILNRKLTQFKYSFVELGDKVYLEFNSSLNEFSVDKLYCFSDIHQMKPEEKPPAKKVRFLIYALLQYQKNEEINERLSNEHDCYLPRSSIPTIDVYKLCHEYLLERVNLLEANLEKILELRKI
ncbi:MAG: hypothetical protein Hyperionvirus3_64 [Hyperionvirus sp.]|uniref:Uncharacterized protein n=1 Tax=Hyperionvirus sp. TaxID=2487770 RepID=A0A3G5A6W5_9VIRU|nr:MAG: hypothetical protein Hyperionvirus3_64 [Hyperionvirus sp.]